MPIDLLSTVKKTSQFAFDSPLLNNILGNSIFIAVCIALLMVLLIMIMYPAEADTPFSVVCKMFLYMFFGSFVIVFLHDGVIKHMMQDSQEEKYQEEILSGVNSQNRVNIYGPQPVIKPNIEPSEEPLQQTQQIFNPFSTTQ